MAAQKSQLYESGNKYSLIQNKEYLTVSLPTAPTASTGNTFALLIPPLNGAASGALVANVTGIWVGVGKNQAGGTGLTVDVKDGATSVFSTVPVYGPTAADNKVASVGGGVITGITQPVLNSTPTAINVGDQLNVIVTSGAYTSTLPTGVLVTLELTIFGDFDPVAAAAVL